MRMDDIFHGVGPEDLHTVKQQLSINKTQQGNIISFGGENSLWCTSQFQFRLKEGNDVDYHKYRQVSNISHTLVVN